MSPPPLKLLSSMATRELLTALAHRYERTQSRELSAAAGGGVEIARRIRGGEVFDIAVLAAGVIDQLIDEGWIAAGSRVDLVQSGIGAAVRRGAPRPDLGTEEAVRCAVLAAKSLSFSTGPSGLYLQGLFERWGILGAIRSRIIVPPPGVPVARLIADGRCELGFQQMSELIDIPGIELVGPLPPPIQLVTVFAGGVAARSRDVDGALAALRFLAAAEFEDVRRRHGMESP